MPSETTADTAILKQKTWFDRALDRAVLSTMKFIARNFFAGEARGLENFKGTEGKPVVIIANHVSLYDAPFLACMLPTTPVFAFDKKTHAKFSKNRFLKFLFNRIGVYPVDSAHPGAVRELTRQAKKGVPVMIFPEGRLTRDNNPMQIFPAAGTIANSAGADVVPAYLEGFEFLEIASDQLPSSSYPKRWFPKLTMTVMPPKRIEIPEGLTGKKSRKEILRQLETIMYELPVHAVQSEPGLIDNLHKAARNFGPSKIILEDVEGKMTYRDVLTKAYALGGFLKDGTKKGKNIGMLLPNSRAGVVSFWAAQAAGRVPAMLNPKAGASTLVSCAETACLDTIVTSRRFVEMAKLEKEIEALSKKSRIVYLEDAPQKIGFWTKIGAWLKSHGILSERNRIKGPDPAMVLFTSGSEGVPKGVVLSSRNLLSNVAQTRRAAAFSPEDRVFNAMPSFHAFGMGGGILMPMLSGCKSFQYPTPLDGKIIPKAAYFFDATVMFGTDTFLSLYARNATPKDFARVRRIFAGAEKLKDETVQTYIDKFNVMVYEGYGMTEASPVVAINGPGENKRGTVGRLVPGMEMKLEFVPGFENGHKLYVRGPNVMMGYLKNDNPGVLQPPEDGWLDTGDIFSFDSEGFMTFIDRAKRLANFGGEKVSMGAIEAVVRGSSPSPEYAHAIVLKKDSAGNDKTVLFTTDPSMTQDRILQYAQKNGHATLGLPRAADIVVIKSMPLLSTGKPDYVSLKALADAPAKNDIQSSPPPKDCGGHFEQSAGTPSPAASAGPKPGTGAPDLRIP